MTANGPPDTKFSTQHKRKHRLRAVEGNFNELIWECELCGEQYTKAKYYRSRCPEA